MCVYGLKAWCHSPRSFLTSGEASVFCTFANKGTNVTLSFSICWLFCNKLCSMLVKALDICLQKHKKEHLNFSPIILKKQNISRHTLISGWQHLHQHCNLALSPDYTQNFEQMGKLRNLAQILAHIDLQTIFIVHIYSPSPLRYLQISDCKVLCSEYIYYAVQVTINMYVGVSHIPVYQGCTYTQGEAQLVLSP